MITATTITTPARRNRPAREIPAIQITGTVASIVEVDLDAIPDGANSGESTITMSDGTVIYGRPVEAWDGPEPVQLTVGSRVDMTVDTFEVTQGPAWVHIAHITPSVN